MLRTADVTRGGKALEMCMSRNNSTRIRREETKRSVKRKGKSAEGGEEQEKEQDEEEEEEDEQQRKEIVNYTRPNETMR